MKNTARLIVLIFSFGILQAQAPLPAGTPAGTPMPAADTEMKQLESEIAAFQKELESLSPEEQESFFKSMEEAVQKIDDLSKTEEGKALLERLDKGDISDEELDQLINQIVGEIEEPEVVPAGVPEPAPKPVEVPKIITSKQEQIINTINAIVAHTSAFIVKAATWPELPGKIKKWEKKKLVEWKPDLTWNKLKSDIEQFISHLNLLLERDQKTKAYYHIDDLLKEEALVNNLKKIQHVISQYEPLIEELSPLGATSTTKGSKQAFQKMINQYSEALYKLTIIDDIKKVLTKFEPTAKAAREAEEKAYQKAELERKRKLVPGAPITVGTPEPEYVRRPSRVEREPRETFRPTPTTYREPDQFRVPTIPSAPKPKAAARGKRGAPGKKEEGAKEDEKEKGKEGKEETLMERLQKQAAKMDEKLFKEADAIVAKVAENIEQVGNTLKKTPSIAQLYTQVTDASPINFELATETIPDLMRDLSVRRGAMGNIEQLHRKLPSSVARKKYQKALAKILDKAKEAIELLLGQLNKLASEWPKIEPTILPSKLYAYFGKVQSEEPVEENQEDIETKLQTIEKAATSVEEGLEKAVAMFEEKKKPVDEALVEAQQKIPTPISLFELRNTIVKLQDMVKNFDQPKIDTEIKK